MPESQPTEVNAMSEQPAEFVYIDGFACDGPKLWTLWVDDFLACQTACAGTAQCAGFTFRPFEFKARCDLATSCDTLQPMEFHSAAKKMPAASM
eukprot:scaffold16687_cov37-Prasinocladus_malaysianus.AAC.1